MGMPSYKTERTPETDLAATVFLMQWLLAKGKAMSYHQIKEYTRQEAWELGMSRACWRAMRRKW